MSSVIPYLSSSLGRRDEHPNIQLAQQIVEKKQTNAVQELIQIVQAKDKKLANDSIKVLYEIGERAPEMIHTYHQTFVELLSSKVNRIQWGSMTALSTISYRFPELLFQHVVKIIDSMQRGSVITKDSGVLVLTNIAKLAKYKDQVIPILLEFIQTAPINQFPTYVERMYSAGLGQYENDLFITVSGSHLFII